ncbi:hypothetical protein [Streptomyces sp. NPDC096030]|uniref:hypothetical protein n=1 Tax=Streptomyces sp. NPDC096030 TaxID=3155423 RepID=UPI00332C2D7A
MPIIPTRSGIDVNTDNLTDDQLRENAYVLDNLDNDTVAADAHYREIRRREDSKSR